MKVGVSRISAGTDLAARSGRQRWCDTSGTFPNPTAWLSLQVSVLVSKPTVEDKSVSDIEVDTCVDGRGGFVEVVGVGRQFAHADLNVGGVGPDTGHAWTRRNSVALEPFVPNRIGTYGPDRTDPSHV